MADQTITLAAAHPDDLQAFKRELQDALLVAVSTGTGFTNIMTSMDVIDVMQQQIIAARNDPMARLALGPIRKSSFGLVLMSSHANCRNGGVLGFGCGGLITRRLA